MNVIELLEDLNRLGICLAAHGDRLRYSPRSAVTPELANRMKAHKSELLGILKQNETSETGVANANAVWQAALDRLEGDPLFPPNLMQALRTADARWANDGESAKYRESGDTMAALQSGEDELHHEACVSQIR